jgi:hypothetical protein
MLILIRKQNNLIFIHVKEKQKINDNKTTKHVFEKKENFK